MVRPNQDRIGGQPKNHVEVDETWFPWRAQRQRVGKAVVFTTRFSVSCAIEESVIESRALRWSHFVGQFGSAVKVYSVV